MCRGTGPGSDSPRSCREEHQRTGGPNPSEQHAVAFQRNASGFARSMDNREVDVSAYWRD